MNQFENKGPVDTDDNVLNDSTNREKIDTYGMLYGGAVQNADSEDIYAEFDEFKKDSNTKKLIIALTVTATVVLAAVFGIRMHRDRTNDEKSTFSPLPVFETTEDEPAQATLVAHIYFDANGGMAEYTEKTAVIGDYFNQFPNVTKEGYLFEGWFTEREGGERVYTDTPVRNSSETVYAHWYEVATVLTTEPTTVQLATTLPPTTKKPETTATSFPKQTEKIRTVLYRTPDMCVFIPEGFILLVHPENEDYYKTGALEEKSADRYIEVAVLYGTSNYSAADFAENYAYEISATVYTETINGTTFSCVDSYDNTLGYKTTLYYIYDGHLVLISGYSKTSRMRIWSMFEGNIYSS